MVAAGASSVRAAAEKISCRSHAGDMGSQCVLAPRPRQVGDFIPDEEGASDGEAEADMPKVKKHKG